MDISPSSAFQKIKINFLISFFSKLLKNKSYKFILFFITGLVCWFSLYHFLYEIDFLFSSKDNTIDIQQSISLAIAKQSNFLLSLLGYQTSIEMHSDMVITLIKNKNFSHGVWIGEPCNGLKLFGVFTVFILAIPGKIIHKIWFIPLGTVAIHLINVIRIAVLTILSSTNPFLLNFNHNVTFQVIVYSFIFFFWFIWIKKFSAINPIHE